MKNLLARSPKPIAVCLALAFAPESVWSACDGLTTGDTITCYDNNPGDVGPVVAVKQGDVTVNASGWKLQNGYLSVVTTPGAASSPNSGIVFDGSDIDIIDANGTGLGAVYMRSNLAGNVAVNIRDSDIRAVGVNTGGVLAVADGDDGSSVSLSNTIVTIADGIGVGARTTDGNAFVGLYNQAGVIANSTNAATPGYGLLAHSQGEGSATVMTEAGTTVDTNGDNVSGIGIISLGGNSAGSDIVFGDLNSQITTNGNSSHGVEAVNNVDSVMDINNGGNIITRGDNALGIRVLDRSGWISVINRGAITTAGRDSSAIYVESTDISSIAHFHIINVGEINTLDAQGIIGRARNGNVYVEATNNITTGQVSATTNNHAIEALTRTDGVANVAYYDGTIKVVGGSANGVDSSIGILAWDGGSGDAGVDGLINLLNTTVIDASRGTTALKMQVSGTGTINIGADVNVLGGSHSAVSFVSTGAGAAHHRLNNQGQIEALSDRIVDSQVAGAGSETIINNYGTLTGYMNFNGSDVTVNNFSSNSWNLRNFADTNGDGVRDTKSVAISDFGAGNAVYLNNASGTMRLAAVSGDTLPANTVGEYLPTGALSIATSGIVQAQLLNLNSFDQRGLIDLGANGLAGDVLVITGASVAGSYGGGEFIANGGRIVLDTILNEGGANSVTDMLVVDDVVVGAGGPTNIFVNQVGGAGNYTVADGIKLIEVQGSAAVDSFVLENIVKSGIYEYTLQQGSLTTPGDQSWYLRNTYNGGVTPSPGPGPGPNPNPIYQLNPDIGSYLGNQTAATTLFMHSLHDRLGETQYLDRSKARGQVLSLWIRGAVGHGKNRAANQALQQHNDSYLIHLGGDIAQWTNGADGRYHLGVMGAYGRNEVKTQSSTTRSQVKGSINGYGAGLYFSWFDNQVAPGGWYADAWSMYSWFDNKTESISKYKTKVWTSSVELGYAMKFADMGRWHWMAEPHGQVAYNDYQGKDRVDANAMSITDADADGLVTRLGGRIYLKDRYGRMNAQPFVEANWLYSSAKNSLKFNGYEFKDDSPKNRFETKFGVQGAVNQHFHVYSHIGLQWGQKNYEKSQGQIGVKFLF